MATTSISITEGPHSDPGVRESKRLHERRPPVATRPAATLLLLRPSPPGFEVLMTRRSEQASFAPGAYVFPGGTVDATDGGPQAQAISTCRPGQDAEMRALCVTAIRESFEELGILLAYRPDGRLAEEADADRFDRSPDADFVGQLASAGFRLAVDQVWWLCHWITDRDLPKRFDVRFLVALTPPGQEPEADEAEQFEPVWVSPQDAIRRYDEGRFSIIFPTERTLRRLQRFPTAEAVIRAGAAERPQFVSSPRGGTLRGRVERFDEFEMQFGELELTDPDGRIVHSLDWQHEHAVPLLRHVQRLTAPNPGMMTGPGTNTYVIGDADSGYAVIDPGPADPIHVDRIAALVGDRLRYILCTHAHSDHSPGAFLLKDLTGAPILGRRWGPRVRDGDAGLAGPVREADPPAFVPDRVLEDGDTLTLGDSTLRAVFTPGHASNHLCFLLVEDGLLFSGDHINNGQTVVINPPDGNMNEYLQALERLHTLPLTYVMPAHGYVLGFARQAIRQLINHRLGREAKVLAAVQHLGAGTVEQLLPEVYGDVDRALFPVAARSLLAHLEKLAEDAVIGRSGPVWESRASPPAA